MNDPEKILDDGNENLKTDYEKWKEESRIILHKEKLKIEPIAFFDGVPVLVKRGITTVSGLPKVRKSGFLKMFAVWPFLLKENRLFPGFSGYEFQLNKEGFPVIVLDTEQDRGLIAETEMRNLREYGFDKMPDNYHIYTLKEIDKWRERQEFLERLLEDLYQEYGGITSIVLDGIAEFLPSVNDEPETLNFYRKLESLAIKFNSPIATSLHKNPGINGNPGKDRGHAGSEQQRKAIATFDVYRDPVSNISWIQPVYCRYGDSSKIHQYKFKHENGILLSAGINLQRNGLGGAYDYKKAAEIMIEFLIKKLALENSNLIEKKRFRYLVEKQLGIKIRSCIDKLEPEMIDRGMITEKLTHKYEINMNWSI